MPPSDKRGDDFHGSGPLAGRNVVLGVCGGIAAYKAVELCRRLVDAGAHVSPVLTEDATRFVGVLTFSALASEPAQTSLWDGPDPIPHTRLGQGADVIVVAPATARVIGKYAAGISDDLLTATLLATRAPVVVCPAMHTEMWEHAAVQDNIALLRRRGVEIVDPEVGRLAGGDEGAGRLAETDTIVAAIERVLGPASESPAGLALGLRPRLARRSERAQRAERETSRAPSDLDGLTVLVTAGGTREPIDPVRFIGNRSSGKQGLAIADEALARGARVVLVTTVEPATPLTGGEVVRVHTAAEMEAAVLERSPSADIVVMAAAVADFRPKEIADEKIKKVHGVPDIVLEPTVDILATLGERRRAGQTLVGFAAETVEVREAAREKLTRKKVDLVVANDVGAPGAGFEHDTNRVVILGADGSEQEGPLTSKRAVAGMVLDAVIAHRRSQ